MIKMTKPDRSVEFKRETWKEFFQIKIAWHFIRYKDEGEMFPRFFLPVERENTRGQLKMWIFPLAPFALAWVIVRNAARCIWKDLMLTGYDLAKFYEDYKRSL